jgi:ABC-type glycerol-3-phosphate transport system substrate-binding protein
MSARRPRAGSTNLRVWVDALGLLIVILAGCVRGTPTPEPVTISFAHPNFDTEHYQRLLQEFNEAYPHITVDLRPRRWDMLSGLGSGDADVFVSTQFAVSWAQDSILNLTPFIEQDDTFARDDFYPGMLGLYTKEGETWGIPAGVDVMVMYYNQDLLDQFGAPYPQSNWDWNDFVEIAVAVRDPVADTYGYVPLLDMFDALAFMYQHGGRIFDDLQDPTRTTFDDPLTIEGLDWFAKLMYDYNVMPTEEQARESFPRGDPHAGVLRGQVGMWTGMLSEQGGQTWNAEWDMRWGVAPLPRDQQSATMTLVAGYFVSQQTEHADACWEWISYVSGEMPNRQTPARKSLVESAEFEGRVGANIAAVARASMEDALLLSPELVEFEEALTLFTQAYQTVVAGTSTPEEAMSWAQQQSKFK